MASLDERGPGLIGITSGQARRDAQRNGKNAESYATELTQNARLNHDVLPPLPAFDRQVRGLCRCTDNVRGERPRRAKASQRSAPAGSSTPRRGAVTVWPVSLNDLCSPQEHGLRNRQPKRLGGLEVDDQLERSRSLHRQVTRLRAL